MQQLTDNQLEREAMILRLRELKVVIAGAEFPPRHEFYIETSWIKDIWQKEEYLAAEKAAKPKQRKYKPDPEHARIAIKEIREANMQLGQITQSAGDSTDPSHWPGMPPDGPAT